MRDKLRGAPTASAETVAINPFMAFVSIVLGISSVLAMALVVCVDASAHRLRPAVASITLLAGGRVDIQLDANFEALLAGIGPKHQDTTDSPDAAQYDGLRALDTQAMTERIEGFVPTLLRGLQLSFDGQAAALQLERVTVPELPDLGRARISSLYLTSSVPAGAESVTWHYDAAFGASVLRIRAGEAAPTTEWLTDGKRSTAFALDPAFRSAPSTWQVFRDYVPVGFTHIVPLGLDHILFVVGIFLLSTRLAPLLWQVTAFTVAHSITLGLALFGHISLSPDVVEPLIALSIVYVAVENLLTRQLKPWRIVVVFAFGLLHGLGFAGVLTEIGLPAGELVSALIAFNIGVELGQLSVIAIGMLSVGIWFGNRDWYRARVVVPGSIAIGLVGLYWSVERTIGF